ncbi:SID1 transmembrane family member 1-like [Folsomia candida]|nr:SID1 transmembrane family member 1-like [Folsomia candida]
MVSNVIFLILVASLSWYSWIREGSEITLKYDQEEPSKSLGIFRGVPYYYKKIIFLSDYTSSKPRSSNINGTDFFKDISGSAIEYLMAVFCSSALYRILTITATSDMSDCYYNRLCTYQIELNMWIWHNLRFKFFLWNSVVSSSAFTLVGAVYFIFVIIHDKLQTKIAKKLKKRLPVLDQISVISEPQEENQLPDCGQNSVRDTNSCRGDVSNIAENNSSSEEVNNNDSNTAKGHQGEGILENQEYGIPIKSGLDKGLAMLLIMEGFVSAMYHICPNLGSYQIEAPFLDMIALLGWIKLQRLRHRSYISVLFTSVIALILSLLELYETIQKYSPDDGFGPYLLFPMPLTFILILMYALHGIYGCFVDHIYSDLQDTNTNLLTVKEVVSELTSLADWRDVVPSIIIAVGNVSLLFTLFVRSMRVITYGWNGADPVSPPEYVDMLIDMLHINIMIGLAIHFFKKIYFEGFRRTDIAPLMCYTSYIGFYVVQWKYHSDLFDWSLSQAESGNLNKECLDGVYDGNDYSKVYKAAYLFAMGMTVTTINDGCVLMNRKFIRVF